MFRKIKGLKYPDEYFVKFFFKNNLHKKNNLKYLEFGCGNGSNLMLPYQYNGNSIIGIDYNESLIEDAKYNFNLFDNNSYKYIFHADDMKSFVKRNQEIKADVLILASVIYYISRNDFIMFLEEMKKNDFLNSNIPFYIRIRTKKDFRYGYGKQISPNRYKMPEISITGENNAEIEFYNESEIIDILKEKLNLRNYKVFHLDNQNEHDNNIILNSDIVIWGTIN